MDERGAETRLARRAGIAIVCVFAIAGVLSVKAACDAWQDHTCFPPWFGPVLGLAAAGLIGGSALACALLLAGPRHERPSGWRAAALFAALPVVGLCTTSLHSFAPFRPCLMIDWWPYMSAVMRLNMAFSLLAVLAPIAIGVAYWRGHRAPAIWALVLLAATLLLPNDDCDNPFNTWWRETIGASPLMFLPAACAALFAACALLGVHFVLMALPIAGIALGVLALGIGHLTRVIW